MTDNKHLQKLNQLFTKLHSTPSIPPSKFKTIQSILSSFQSTLSQTTQSKKLKIQTLTNKLLHFQNSLNEDILKRQQKQQLLNSHLIKVQKTCFKTLDIFNKQRQQSDKKLQASIQNCLSQINNYRLKTQTDCTNSIKQIESLVEEIDCLTKQVQNQGLLSKEILKKIYIQFMEQIEELRGMIMEEKEEREKQEEVIVGRLQEVYKGMIKKIGGLKANRQKSQKLLVDLLERVIDKVRKEMTGY